MHITRYFLLCCLVAAFKFAASQVADRDSLNTKPLLMEQFCVKFGYCYSIWRTNPPLTKRKAQDYCLTQNQTLATIFTPQEEETLAKQLSDNAWIGLSLTPRTDWKWLGRNEYHQNSIPDGIINDEANGACMLINRDELRSFHCSFAFVYICEFSEAPSSVVCGEAPVKVGNRWICLSSSLANWMIAAQECDREKGNLLTIASVEELRQVKEVLQLKSSHYWTAATKVMLKWDEPDVEINPYSLTWSENFPANPNLDESYPPGNPDFCIYLSKLHEAFVFRRCEDALNQVICSSINKNPVRGIDLGREPQLTRTTATTERIQTDQTTANSTNTNPSIHQHTTTSSSIIYVEKTLSYTPKEARSLRVSTINMPAINSDSHRQSSATTASSSIMYAGKTLNYTSKETSPPKFSTIGKPEFTEVGVSKEKYKTVMICAYILATLLVIAVAFLVAIFIWRRRRRKRKLYNMSYNRKTYKTLGNGTLGRQRTTDPMEEWDKVMTENEDNFSVQMREKSENDLDIVHNAPLEEPLTIPRESHIVTLQRGKSMDSANSLASSDVATFTIDRRNSTTSILKVPPPLPPKPAPTAAEQGLGLPPPPPYLLINSNELGPAPPKTPPPPLDLVEPSQLPPPPPPDKPAKRPPRKQKKRQIEPDPVYAQIDKPSSRKLPPPPTSPKPKLHQHTNGLPPPPLCIDTAVPSDNYSDSGVDMAVNSPPHRFHNGHHKPAADDAPARMALLDDIVNHMTNS